MLNGGPETGIARPGCTKRSITRRGGSVDRRQSSRNSKRTSFRRARSAPRFLRVHVIDRAAKHAYSGARPAAAARRRLARAGRCRASSNVRLHVWPVFRDGGVRHRAGVDGSKSGGTLDNCWWAHRDGCSATACCRAFQGHEGLMLLTSVFALALLIPAQAQTPVTAPAEPQEQ